SDITLQSSDRVLFKVHRRNLEMYSQVFSDAANATATSSAVLDLMFQYTHPLPQPDPRKVDFNVVKDVAEA
ncbi:hypothetical protein K435DRAFT_610629, partial [Dendrothele bispora CBS 962.96]